jgi:hypothetical protein
MQPRLLVTVLLTSIIAVTVGGACFTRIVNPPVAEVSGLMSLAIEPPTTTMTMEQLRHAVMEGVVNLKATGMINGASEDMTTRVLWACDPPGAKVSPAGVVSTGTPGTYTITATNGKISATATVVMIAPELKMQ